eukprot:13527743-Alexandrium_andersonii.AAC.1
MGIVAQRARAARLRGEQGGWTGTLRKDTWPGGYSAGGAFSPPNQRGQLCRWPFEIVAELGSPL